MLHQNLAHRNTGLFLVLVLLGGLLILLSTAYSPGSPGFISAAHSITAPSHNDTKILKSNLEQMPLYFIENRGQLDSQVAYYMEGKDKTLYFTSAGITFSLAGTQFPVSQASGVKETGFSTSLATNSSSRYVVKLDFLNADPHVRPVGQEQSETLISYFKGHTGDWKTGLSTYTKLVYPNLWPGIDLVYSGTVNQLKYEFVVKPGADPDQILLAYKGAAAVRINEAGQLEVETAGGNFRDDTPYAYQQIAGQRVLVTVGYKLGNESSPDVQPYGFQVGSYDPTQPLILDPALLIYAGFISGSTDEVGQDIAIDSAGNAYITGVVFSAEDTFPVLTGPNLTYDGNGDAFVAKVKADGTGLIYLGYIGGTEIEQGYGIAVDSAGFAYVTGWTCSNQNSFPVTVGPDLTFNESDAGSDAFVAKISADGTALVYAGYIGGDGVEEGYGIAVDSFGYAYIAGWTSSYDFPASVGPDLTLGGADAFVAKIKADGTGLSYAGYIGGTGGETGYGIAVDNTGSAYVTGLTYSDESTFPVTVGPDLTFSWGVSTQEAFVAKVKADGTGFDYAGYIGGTSSDWGRGITVDSVGNAYVTGWTYSDETTFPAVAGPDLTYNGGGDAFIAKIKVDGTGFDYAGYIGGTDADWGKDIAVDDNGSAYVTGGTDSNQNQGFPATNGPDLTHNGYSDAFVAKIKANGSGLLYSGFIGGSHNDEGNGIVVDNGGNVYLTGETHSDEITFPVRNGPGLTPGGYADVFAAKVIESQVYSITGQVTDGNNPISDVTIFSETGGSAITDASGFYTLTNLISGTYILTPSKNTYTFSPVTRTVNVPPSVTGQNFTGGITLTDIDGDGLLDNWEEKGVDFDSDGTIDVDLPGMGAKKDHKDIFVQVDWLTKGGFLGHSHKPDNEAINKVVQAFANAPVNNLDGWPGINLHVIFGKEVVETIENQELGAFDSACGYSWVEFDSIKSKNFSLEKRPVFHYVVFGHRLPYDPCLDGHSSGISRNKSTNNYAHFSEGASDFIVAVYSWEINPWPGVKPNAQAGTFMHELGHNLGLGHGGLVLNDQGQVIDADHISYKPNHLSVMNYSFQTRGLRKKGGPLGLFGNAYFDYSRFGSDVLPNLVESNLSEPQGLDAGNAVRDYGTRYYCQGSNDEKIVDGLQQAIDWNCDGDKKDINISTSINQDLVVTTTLTTVNEWLYLKFNGGAVGANGALPELPETTSMAISPELTFEQDLQIGPFGPDSSVYLPVIVK